MSLNGMNGPAHNKENPAPKPEIDFAEALEKLTPQQIREGRLSFESLGDLDRWDVLGDILDKQEDPDSIREYIVRFRYDRYMDAIKAPTGPRVAYANEILIGSYETHSDALTIFEQAQEHLAAVRDNLAQSSTSK